jgi:hypothetical protein
MDKWYLHAKTVFLGGGTQRSLLVRPSQAPFPGALIQRGDSWPTLPRVELIQKVSTKQALSRRSVSPVRPLGGSVREVRQTHQDRVHVA